MTVKHKQKPRKPGGSKSRARRAPPPSSLWFYGRHAVDAALKNPDRPLRRVIATKTAIEWLEGRDLSKALLSKITPVTVEEIDQHLPSGAVHQGLAAEVDDLPRPQLKDICANPSKVSPVMVLDQITDPQNIGAVFRSAAAFGARAVIVQDRRTPPLSGALAKAAAGAVETLPCVLVVNIARVIGELQELGYHCAGLAGEADSTIDTLATNQPTAIVLGAEGAGLRRLVSEKCDELYRIPIARNVESLNVSNAAAIALYQATRITE